MLFGERPKFVCSTVPVAFTTSLWVFELKSFISSENIFFATSESFSSASMFFAIVDFISLGKLEFTDSVNSLTEIGFIDLKVPQKLLLVFQYMFRQ